MTTDDTLTDLTNAIESAIRRAYAGEETRLESLDVEITPEFTIPECHRKTVSIGIRIECQVDGSDFNANLNDALAAVRVLGDVR